ncbi:MAG: DoxX family protein [Rhodospirillum sp.]|nr:DoxX family protein [Rhodospirillum sp.]MCF8488690.1 DoxX family protein [Rhodospirillum sp.]MCF8501552.1 DoxX family protein [Rhodospirillum sp.]
MPNETILKDRVPGPSPGLSLRAVERARILVAQAGRLPDGLIALCARISLASIFWASGQTKVISTTAFSILGREIGVPVHFPPHLHPLTPILFAEEYRVPLLSPDLAAWMAALGEMVFPLLLLLGLATRLSALGLLGMTLVIQVFVYPNLWSDHLLWAAGLLFLIAKGPGWLSLDALVAWRVGGR